MWAIRINPIQGNSHPSHPTCRIIAWPLTHTGKRLHSTGLSVITGSSTHNERMECLWRDVTRLVSSTFRESFQQLEYMEELDPLNNVDIFCLHWVYLPRINLCLQQSVESWNNHSLSSEHNQTPNQLFVQGILMQENSSPTVNTPSGSTVSIQLVIEWQLQRENLEHAIHYTGGSACSLQSIQLYTPTEDNGIFLYRQVVTVVGSHLQAGCGNCI